MEGAFFPDGAPEGFRGLLTPLYEMDGALTFAASVAGKMAAAEPVWSSPGIGFLPCAELGQWRSIAVAGYKRGCYAYE